MGTLIVSVVPEMVPMVPSDPDAEAFICLSSKARNCFIPSVTMRWAALMIAFLLLSVAQRLSRVWRNDILRNTGVRVGTS